MELVRNCSTALACFKRDHLGPVTFVLTPKNNTEFFQVNKTDTSQKRNRAVRCTLDKLLREFSFNLFI